MKKFAKLILALVIICCLIFAALTLQKVQEQVGGLNEKITTLETEKSTLTEQLSAVTAELDAAKAAAIESDTREIPDPALAGETVMFTPVAAESAPDPEEPAQEPAPEETQRIPDVDPSPTQEIPKAAEPAFEKEEVCLNFIFP